jgi:hypothetical protein
MDGGGGGGAGGGGGGGDEHAARTSATAATAADETDRILNIADSIINVTGIDITGIYCWFNIRERAALF